MLPYFSIIIPTYNRPQSLVACLQSIAELDYPRNRFEVIVVDDGGRVFLDEVIAPFSVAVHLTLIRQENAGPATARNRGSQLAKGAVLAFTDDDCQPALNWLNDLATYFQDAPMPDTDVCSASSAKKPPAGIPYAVGGYTVNALPNNICATASQALIDYLYQQYNANPKDAGFFTSNNLAIAATDFLALGGFDESFPLAAAEDRDLWARETDTAENGP